MSLGENKRKIKKHIHVEGDTDLWLITYADLITLLLCFFILLFASANIDQNVWDQVKASYNSKVKNKKVSTPLSEIKYQLDSMLMKEVNEKNLEIENKDNAINMRFLSNSFYNSGDAILLPEGKDIVDKIFDIIDSVSKSKKADFKIDVEGHTDDNPIKTKEFPSNWELSVARASNVVRYLIDRGMEPGRLKASGYADTQPVVPNRNPQGVALPDNQSVNRRVVLRIHY